MQPETGTTGLRGMIGPGYQRVMRKLVISLAVGGLAAAGVAAAPASDRADRAAARLTEALQGRVAGKPVQCLPASMTSSSEIIDQTAILYRSGSRLYLNTPRGGQQFLHRDRILVVDIHGGQLCRQDVVRLLERDTQAQTGFVVLGDFVPYTKATK